MDRAGLALRKSPVLDVFKKLYRDEGAMLTKAKELNEKGDCLRRLRIISIDTERPTATVTAVTSSHLESKKL